MGRRGWAFAAIALIATATACGSTTVRANGSSTTTAHPTSTSASNPSTTSTSVATTVAGQATTVVADCGSGAYKPARVVVTCANAGVVATEVHWSSWTTTRAVGTSVVQVNTCKPSCAAVSAKPYPGELVLSDPVSTSHGPRFSQLTIAWTGSPPQGTATNTYALTTST